MKILAIDTSTSAMGIALLDSNKVYAEIITNLKKNHSLKLMPFVDQLFTEAGWKPHEIELIGVAKGPGSYTGVRIGVTTAKTMAWSLDVPLVGISTLETMAYSNYAFTGYLSPILDARRGQIYTGLYKNINGEDPVIIEQERIVLLSDWLDMVKKLGEETLFIGDDVSLHHEQITDKLGPLAKFNYHVFNLPRPSVIGWLAKERFQSGDNDNIFDFTPEYLQLAEAEAKWLAKQNNRN